MKTSALKNGRWVAVAIAALLAVFAGGAFAGQALAGDDEKPVTRLTLGAAPSTTGAGADGDAALSAEESARSAAGAASDLRYWPYCPAELPASAVGATIDPTAAGIAVRFLGSGFELQSVTLRAEGECDEAGTVTNAIAVLDSTWLRTATGVSVWVSQRESGEVANYIDQWSALVWSDGYAFQISAAGGYPMPLAEDKPGADDAAIVLPSDAEVTQVLNEAVSQLAPGVSDECFYRVVDGVWEDLASFGLGDPRGSIPSGYAESHASIRILQPPAESCGAPELEGVYAPSIDASFTDSAGGWIGLSAYRSFDTQAHPGSSSAGSVYWSDGEWQFSVYGYGADGTPVAMETLTAIAQAFAPGFEEQCLAVDTVLTEEDLVAAGFNIPVVPEGYTLEKSSFTLNAFPADCEVEEGVGGAGYQLHWVFVDGEGDYIEVSTSRPEVTGEVEAGGWLDVNGAGWTNVDGTTHHISSSRSGAEAPLTVEEITAIALSLDPGLDPASLDDAPEVLPVEPDGAPATRAS